MGLEVLSWSWGGRSKVKSRLLCCILFSLSPCAWACVCVLITCMYFHFKTKRECMRLPRIARLRCLGHTRAQPSYLGCSVSLVGMEQTYNFQNIKAQTAPLCPAWRDLRANMRGKEMVMGKLKERWAWWSQGKCELEIKNLAPLRGQLPRSV